MAEQTFQIVVNGKLTEGAELEQVKQNIAKLFKTSVEKVEPMFSGRKMAVKKGLDQQTALKYKAAIMKAGLAAGVIPMATSAQPQSQQASTTQTTASLDSASIAAPGSIMDDTPPPAEPKIDTSSYIMGSVGDELAEHSDIPEPDIDISELSIGEVGEDVTKHEAVPDADIDTSQISLGEVGEDVTEAVETPPANIDTSQLTMGEAGEDVMEHKPVPPAKIDTSQLTLDESDK